MSISRNRHVYWHSSVFVVLLVNSASNALATDRYYSDVTATSGDGKLRLEAKSSDNEKGVIAFASNFTYRLIDTTTGKVIWTRPQKDDAPPSQAFIHNSGWVVIHTVRDELVVLKPKRGTKTCLFKILDQFPENEREKYVHETTAGPRWAGGSRWFLVDGPDDSVLLVVRTWWGRRVILDVTDACLLKDTGDLKKLLDQNDRDYVMATLKKAADGPERCYEPQGNSDFDYFDVMCAIRMAGRIGAKEAIPHLQKLERWTCSCTSVSLNACYERTPSADPWDYSSYHVYNIRQAAQLSLRRLGQTPDCFPAVRLYTSGRSRTTRKPWITEQAVPNRASRVNEIKPGMPPSAVLAIIGAPDFLAKRQIAPNNGECDAIWEYDMDGAPPFTFEVSWSCKTNSVKAATSIEGAKWKQEDVRDFDLE